MADDSTENIDNHRRPQMLPTPVIVGIGASAGGIRALQAFFEALPPNTGAAFVVVVHLDPASRSELSSILAGWTSMPVVQVLAKESLQPDRVYVIPPDRRLDVSADEISASEFDEPRGKRAPIDLFFRSLAEHGDGFAVVLTGAGADGAMGVKVVKEAGGIILVQDPEEAEYPSMPRAAIATGTADFVLPVREIAARLVELIKAKLTVALGEMPTVDEDLLRRILAHLRIRTGHDFSKYKRSTVIRRLARRMQVTRTDNLHDYYDYLRERPDEAQALLADLLISVTTFFRDSEAFDALRSQVVPQLFHAKEVSETIRVWVPGCATGEEAYSIAILLLEQAARRELRPAIQVFGTDLDGRALAVAREGRFPAAIEADVSEERLRRFFQRETDHYRVRPDLRDILLFASHDLLKDPPFSRVDLISCRNVLIYLDRELQQQVISTFQYALNPAGFLFLGTSETGDSPPGLFRLIDRTARISQSTAHFGDKRRILPPLLGGVNAREQPGPAWRQFSRGAAVKDAVLHRRAIEKVAPPNMLVDDGNRVVHLSENAGRYIQPSGGALSGDAVDLVRPELRFELRSALHAVFEHRRSTLSLPILVHFNGAPRRVYIQVKPASDADADNEARMALVLFFEGEAVDDSRAGWEQPAADHTVLRLTQELEQAQQRLRTMREESEASNEELRAANEELQSINEEYHSTSEELETSKEELQSINEELQTVNSELKLKLEAVSRAHNDLQNLMAATDFGTLFLDSGLRIKRFTDRVTDLFRVTPADEGRPITDFAHQLEYDDLIREARAVLVDLAPIRREIRSRSGRWYDVRLRPYRTAEDKIDGVVVSFIDITERRQVEQALRDSERQLQQQKRLVDLSRGPIFVWELDGGIVDWNRGCEELYGYLREEVLGRQKEQILSTRVPGASFAELKTRLVEDGSWSGELMHRSKDGRELVVEARLQLEASQGRRLVLESTRDITDHKLWEQRQRLLLGELTHRVKNTLAVVQAIAHQTLRADGSTEDFVASFDGRLAALASAHDLLFASNWQGADLATLAHRQLDHYLAENPQRLRIEGEPLLLPADVATPFGLVLHELATNAAKHGSLSRPTGAVDVSWTQSFSDSRRVLLLTWREIGGPVVRQPTTNGFGSVLIENGIPSATVKREFLPEGFACTIEVSLPRKAEVGNDPAALAK